MTGESRLSERELTYLRKAVPLLDQVGPLLDHTGTWLAQERARLALRDTFIPGHAANGDKCTSQATSALCTLRGEGLPCGLPAGRGVERRHLALESVTQPPSRGRSKHLAVGFVDDDKGGGERSTGLRS